jgi:hypothetical protein
VVVVVVDIDVVAVSEVVRVVVMIRNNPVGRSPVTERRSDLVTPRASRALKTNQVLARIIEIGIWRKGSAAPLNKTQTRGEVMKSLDGDFLL